MPCPLYHQISQRTDCKYSKGKRGEWRETRKLTIKVKTRSLEILLSTHTYSKPLLVLCIRLLLHHWRKLSKIMQIQTFFVTHNYSLFLGYAGPFEASSGRDCCRLSHCSNLGIDFIAFTCCSRSLFVQEKKIRHAIFSPKNCFIFFSPKTHFCRVWNCSFQVVIKSQGTHVNSILLLD